jgi:hypothetical protein
MRLIDAVGQILEIEIVGYQFPDEASRIATRERARQAGMSGALAPRNRHDNNWLFIRGRLETLRGTWDFLEPCLETGEARELAGWLRAAASSDSLGTLGFTEPVIEFESATPDKNQADVKVVVNFALEGRPPWSTAERFDQAPVEFVFSRGALAHAAEELERELLIYPER